MKGKGLYHLLFHVIVDKRVEDGLVQEFLRYQNLDSSVVSDDGFQYFVPIGKRMKKLIIKINPQ